MLNEHSAATELYRDENRQNDDVREARQLFDGQNYGEARRIAKRYLERSSGSSIDDDNVTIEMLRIVVDSLIRQGHRKEAIPYLGRLVELTDDAIGKQRRQVLLIYITGDLGKAMSLADELIASPGIGDPELLLCAEIAANNGEYDTALAMLKDVSPESKEKAVVIEAHCLAATGRIDAAIDLLGAFESNNAPGSVIREHSLRLQVMRFEQETLLCNVQ